MKSDEQKLIDKWGDRKLIEETIKSMGLHDEPAPETRERLSTLEANQETIMNYLEENKGEHKEIRDTLIVLNKTVLELPEKIFEKGDERYASKTSEKVVYAMIGLVCSGFVLLLWEIIKDKI